MGYKLTNLCAWEGLQLACSFLDITVIFKNHDQLVQYDLQQIPVFGVLKNRKSCRMVELLQHV